MPEWAQWPFPNADPYPAYRAARDQAPVQWHYDLGAHLVLDHAHAKSILRSPQWSSDPRTSPQFVDSLGEFIVEQWSRSLLMSDPPTHTRLRSAVNRFFTPRAVRGLRDRVSAIVDAALEPFDGGQRIELMAEVASAIPLAVIAELFDVGVEGAQLLQSEAPTLACFLELDPTPTQVQAFAGAAMNIMLFLIPIVSERRQRPGDDLISTLIHPDDGGVRLDIDEVITMCLLLLAAGHVTTASSLSDQMLGDVTVRRGDQAVIVLGAANRDPARYADPDQLDLERNNPSHLAFGHGSHFCIGAALARLEAQATFTRLAQPLARARATGWTSQRDDSITIRRLRTLTLGGAPAQAGLGEAEARGRSAGEDR